MNSPNTKHAYDSSLSRFLYSWPYEELPKAGQGRASSAGSWLKLDMNETEAELAKDSRWPVFFPSPICLVTTGDGKIAGLERVVGPSVVNRFPYVLALSLCRRPLSDRHYPRAAFCELMEQSGAATVQFLRPGASLSAALAAIQDTPEERTTERLSRAGLKNRPGVANSAPLLEEAYLAYECKLEQPYRGSQGEVLGENAFRDLGSHRAYFLRIKAIHLDGEIAAGRQQIRWRSLPIWNPSSNLPGSAQGGDALPGELGYRKGFEADYRFPSARTTSFRAMETKAGMAVHYPDHEDISVIQQDNDASRWPCFFPAPLGMVTSHDPQGGPNVMPCGSCTVLSRHPFIVGIGIASMAINQRYAPRASLGYIRRTGRFGLAVPFDHTRILQAIGYSGNISHANDPDKMANAGLSVDPDLHGPPVLSDCPINLDCRLAGEVNLGSHQLLLGEVRVAYLRSDLGPDNPMSWSPWPTVVNSNA